MRAAVWRGAGNVRVEERPDPGPPGEGEVRLAVLRASLCGTDVAEWDHGPVLVRGESRVLGHEFVGRVEAAGPGVDGLAVGDRVTSGAGVWCGACARCAEGRTNLCERYFTLGLQADGGLAERVVAPAATCVRVPDACSDEAAALAQPMAVAIHALRRGGPADTLVVHGVGGIGAFAVAAAVHDGVRDVVAVDIDPARLDRARRLGAHAVVDARAGNVAATVRARTGGRGADVVLEASGAGAGPAVCLAAARAGGRLVIVGLQKRPVALDLLDVALREIDVVGTLAHVCATDLPAALDVLATSAFAHEVVDRTIPLAGVVDDGLAAVAAGRVAGKVLVDPSGAAPVARPGYAP